MGNGSGKPIEDEEEDHLDVNKRIIDEMVKGSFDDHAFGCIFGAFIGDSCGSANEFNKNIETEDRMDEIMTMPGEGPWNLSPG